MAHNSYSKPKISDVGSYSKQKTNPANFSTVFSKEIKQPIQSAKLIITQNTMHNAKFSDFLRIFHRLIRANKIFPFFEKIFITSKQAFWILFLRFV